MLPLQCPSEISSILKYHIIRSLQLGKLKIIIITVLLSNYYIILIDVKKSLCLNKTINREPNYITINCNKTKLNSYLMVTRCSCGSTNGKKCCILVNPKKFH